MFKRAHLSFSQMVSAAGMNTTSLESVCSSTITVDVPAERLAVLAARAHCTLDRAIEHLVQSIDQNLAFRPRTTPRICSVNPLIAARASGAVPGSKVFLPCIKTDPHFLWRNAREFGTRASLSDINRVLKSIEQGDRKAADELLPLVYDELRKLAAAKMASQPAGHTLQPTALVHEAWLRLVGADATFAGRTHFFASAAEAMRHILVDHARHKLAQRHGGGHQRVEFDEAGLAAPGQDDQILAVNDALDKLAAENKLGADLVKLRYFGGMTLAEAAQALGVSERTADNYWAYAKAWLVREIEARRR